MIMTVHPKTITQVKGLAALLSATDPNFSIDTGSDVVDAKSMMDTPLLCRDKECTILAHDVGEVNTSKLENKIKLIVGEII